MKHKTAELTGEALNQAVALANAEDAGVVSYADYAGMWEYGGPIIERERIALNFYATKKDGRYWGSSLLDEQGCEVPHPDPAQHALMSDGFCPAWACGPTPLIAAMRAFVSSKLGEEVELP